MDLSTAIREGIKLHPHAVSGRYTAIRSGEPHAVCVMTAAWAGLGHRVSRMLDKVSGTLPLQIGVGICVGGWLSKHLLK